jgi:hypothetical protein
MCGNIYLFKQGCGKAYLGGPEYFNVTQLNNFGTVELLCLAAPSFSIIFYCEPHFGGFWRFWLFDVFLGVFSVF